MGHIYPYQQSVKYPMALTMVDGVIQVCMEAYKFPRVRLGTMDTVLVLHMSNHTVSTILLHLSHTIMVTGVLEDMDMELLSVILSNLCLTVLAILVGD